jgi:hypothetical protein
MLHRTNTKGMIQQTVGHSFILQIGGLFFSTYHKAMSFFCNPNYSFTGRAVIFIKYQDLQTFVPLRAKKITGYM